MSMKMIKTILILVLLTGCTDSEDYRVDKSWICSPSVEQTKFLAECLDNEDPRDKEYVSASHWTYLCETATYNTYCKPRETVVKISKDCAFCAWETVYE